MTKTLQSSTALVTAPDSFATLKRYVVDYVQGGNDPELLDVAGRAINRAIDRINAKTWQKQIARQTFTTRLNTAEYTLNKDFKDPINLSLMNSGQYPAKRLPYKDYKSLEIENPNAENAGTPTHYTVHYHRRTLVLSLDPAQSFVDDYPYMALLYHNRLAYLAGDSDRHGADPEFNGFIGWLARADIAAVRGERSLAQTAKAEASDIWRDLRESDNNTVTDWSEY